MQGWINMICKLLILGHLVGDFYVQSDKVAVGKGRNKKMLLKHCIYYGMSLFLCSFFMIRKLEIVDYVICTLGISVVHAFIDCVKINMEYRMNIDKKYELKIFLGDQFLHVLTVYLFYKIFSFTNNTNLFFLSQGHNPDFVDSIILGTIGILICGRPAGIFVKMILTIITGEFTTYNKENANVGFAIGILEREIILFLGILGQFGAIGFVLTAKSIARFKQLEDKEFAEKYLVGTLLSAIIAILCIGMYTL